MGTATVYTTLKPEQVETLIAGTTRDPFTVLGAHPVDIGGRSRTAVRTFLPGARSVTVLADGGAAPVKAAEVNPRGLFEALLPPFEEYRPYRLKVEWIPGRPSLFYDCYSFSPVLSEYDLFLFNQGNHYEIYEKLGAHPVVHQGVAGTSFAVWAPSAARVSVVGDFNQWDGRRHQMRERGSSGVWELFIPKAGPGLLYKYEILTSDGNLLLKTDPFAFRMEKRPGTASEVYELDGFEWTDQDWMQRRRETSLLNRPMSVYEMHLGSWRRGEGGRWLTYRELADQLIPYVKELGFTHIEMMPPAEHPFDASWGYQVTGYYAATSRYGTPHDLMHFIDRCHAENIGVILDWVPAHFPRDDFALANFDGTHLYEHADPRQGAHRDWGTLIFNYGRNEVRNFLTANALFWLDKYHIDGLRVDAVASMLYLDYSRQDGDWVPNRFGGRENLEAIEFIKNFNAKVYEKFPGAVTIAEESTSWPAVSRPIHLGGLGFMFKWNMGWMHDMLSFMSLESIFRKYHTNYLTFALLYAFHENFILPLSHDEVVHLKKSLLDKMPGDHWQKAANLRLLLGYMFGEPGKKMLFMGGEIGQWGEWNHDLELEWGLLNDDLHQGVQTFMKDLNALYRSEPALYELDYQPDGFEWIDFRDADSTVISFIRRGKNRGEELVFVFNFTPVVREGYRVGVPSPGFYQERLNSDSSYYGGSNVGLGGGLETEPKKYHGRPQSLNLTLPPLGMLVLKPEPGPAAVLTTSAAPGKKD